ncbi:MAG: hypothetical protein ACRDK7_06980 [Solirubrobacteraceae bacterium]
MSTVTSTTSTRVGPGRRRWRRRSGAGADSLASLESGGLARARGSSTGAEKEGWVTKPRLAAHLQVTPRWIERQHAHGLPHLRRGRIVRYRISDVEARLLSSPAVGGS